MKLRTMFALVVCAAVPLAALADQNVPVPSTSAESRPATNGQGADPIAKAEKSSKDLVPAAKTSAPAAPATTAAPNPLASAAAGALFLATAVGLVILGVGPNMLRDPLPQDGTSKARPFSLGRTQMAWWFLIIVGCYLYLWAIHGTPPALSPTLLSLAGISGATGVMGVAVSETQKTAYPASAGFFHDLVTDKDGVTLHRFQMLSMTVILGVVFVIQVATNKAVPADFDATMLGLMGISSAMYLGFKVPEKQSQP